MNHPDVEVKQKGMSKGKPPAPSIVVIFGATGDLTHRELIPSLFALNCKKLLPAEFAIIGFARRDWSDDTFRDEMYRATKVNAECSENEWKTFAKRMFYVRGNFNDDSGESYDALKGKISELQNEYRIDDNILFHLATPPSFYGTIISLLDKSGLSKSDKGWRRVIIEKPFGEDEKSAQELDGEIKKTFSENQIFRIDHYLGKETVQNMLVFRFANAGFEPIWNRNYIDSVQITVAENLGIGTRANFYEKTGVVRDMVQNHLLQLLCVTALEPPVNYDAESLRTETLQVLRSICQIDIESDVVLGQYDSGEIKSEKVKAYREEDKVDSNSTTPTFAALKLKLDNWRWAGVPFYLRTGKRLPRKLTEVTIHFKSTPHLMFPIDKNEERGHNILTFRLQPDEGIIYTFTAKHPGAELVLRPVNLNFNYNKAFSIDGPPSSYQWLIFDAMKGDQTLFPRADWIYRAWSTVDPIIKKWENEPWLNVPNYSAGTWGPKEAEKLIGNKNTAWSAE